MNNDGFLDNPLSSATNLFNRWQYINPTKGTVGFFGYRFMNDKKEIGEINDDKLPLRKPWKGEIHTKRFDSSFKYGYVNPKIPYQSLGFQMAFSNHDQKSFFGERNLDLNQKSFYSSLIYNSIIGSTLNKIKVGFNIIYFGLIVCIKFCFFVTPKTPINSSSRAMSKGEFSQRRAISSN